MFPGNKPKTNSTPFHSFQWLGQRISMVREILDLTPAQLAKLMQTSSQTVARVEQGRKQLPIDWLYKLTHFLGIDANWLLDGIGPNAENKKTAYDELLKLIQVPEVAITIDGQLQISKLIFKDQIKETIMKVKKVSPRTSTDNTDKRDIDYP